MGDDPMALKGMEGALKDYYYYYYYYYHYMLPPYKGRRPDGHTRDLREHSPVLGNFSCLACAFFSVAIALLAHAQLVGLEPETLPPS